MDTIIELKLASGLYVLSMNRFYRKFLLICALSASRISVLWEEFSSSDTQLRSPEGKAASSPPAFENKRHTEVNSFNRQYNFSCLHNLYCHSIREPPPAPPVFNVFSH